MMRLKTPQLAVALFVILFGGIFLSMALGKWKTTSSKEPARISQGDFAGAPNPADIRGSYTWEDLEKAFGVPAAEAAAAFSTPGMALKTAEKINVLESAFEGKLPEGVEIGTDSVRFFVSRYAGLPFEPGEGTALPASAVAYLEKLGKADEAVRKAAVSLVGGEPAAPSAAPAPTAGAAASAAAESQPASSSQGSAGGSGDTTHVAEDRKVGGTTTFADLYSWGLSKAEVEQAVGFKPPADSTAVRDAVQKNGASFSTIKTELQKLVDARK